MYQEMCIVTSYLNRILRVETKMYIYSEVNIFGIKLACQSFSNNIAALI